MSGIYDVFDSWGNKVGEFVPNGQGCGSFLLAILGLIAFGLCSLMEKVQDRQMGEIYGETCTKTRIEVHGSVYDIYSNNEFPLPYTLGLSINGQEVKKTVNWQSSYGHDQFDFGEPIREIKIVTAWLHYAQNELDCHAIQVFP